MFNVLTSFGMWGYSKALASNLCTPSQQSHAVQKQCFWIFQYGVVSLGVDGICSVSTLTPSLRPKAAPYSSQISMTFAFMSLSVLMPRRERRVSCQMLAVKRCQRLRSIDMCQSELSIRDRMYTIMAHILYSVARITELQASVNELISIARKHPVTNNSYLRYAQLQSSSAETTVRRVWDRAAEKFKKPTKREYVYTKVLYPRPADDLATVSLRC